MSGMRFTTWLSGEERDALRALAARLGCSENFIVRIALRSLLFGNEVPDYMQSAAAGNRSNTSDGNTNTDKHTTGARA